MQTNTKITLEDIIERKKSLKNKIETQKKTVSSTAHEIFSPLVPTTNKTNVLMRSFNTGIAVFDGVMMGIKMMRKIRRYFRGLQ